MSIPEPLPLPTGYTQRDWTPDDVAAVAALDADLFGPDAWSQKLFEAEYQTSMTDHPNSYYQVIEYNHEIVGFAGLLYSPPFADITTIGIHPDHTRKKLGAALLIWLIRTAYDLGAEDMLLEVRADNVVAQQLYADNGFEHIHTRPRYYPLGEDAFIMRKRLRDPGESTAVALTDKE